MTQCWAPSPAATAASRRRAGGGPPLGCHSAAGAVNGTPYGSASPPRRSFVWQDSLMYRRSPWHRPSVHSRHLRVLQELHSTPLGGHFGPTRRSRWLARPRSSVWRPCLTAAVKEYIQKCPAFHRVKADHFLPAGLRFLLPVLTRSGGCIGLDFIELLRAHSGHDFMQVHIGPRLAYSDHEDTHHRDYGQQLHVLGIPRRGAARRSHLGPRHAPYECSLEESARGAEPWRA